MDPSVPALADQSQSVGLSVQSNANSGYTLSVSAGAGNRVIADVSSGKATSLTWPGPTKFGYTVTGTGAGVGFPLRRRPRGLGSALSALVVGALSSLAGMGPADACSPAVRPGPRGVGATGTDRGASRVHQRFRCWCSTPAPRR
jgi:hypothetical protein